MNRAPNPFAEQRIDIAADDDADEKEQRSGGVLLAYLPARKKRKLKL